MSDKNNNNANIKSYSHKSNRFNDNNNTNRFKPVVPRRFIGPSRDHSGRAVISVHKILSKNQRYDNKVEKDKKFYEKIKRFKKYKHLLKREGLEGTDNTKDYAEELSRNNNNNLEQNQINENQNETAIAEDPIEEKKASIEELNEYSKLKAEKFSANHKRKLPETTSADNNTNNNQQFQRNKANGNSNSRKRVKIEKPVRKTREQIEAERLEHERELALKREQRLMDYRKHAVKTKRGQPIMKTMIQDVLSKLQKSNKK